MPNKSRQQVMIVREEQELELLLDSLPENPIPWATVVQLIAPLVARLAVRYGLRRAKRGLSEERISAIANLVSDRIRNWASIRSQKAG